MSVIPASLRGMTAGEKRSLRMGLLFISPWLFGFLFFSLNPVGNLALLQFDQL